MKSPEQRNHSNLELLQKRLNDANINTSSWGTGQAKTLEQLQEEIEEGETILITEKNGELLRKLVIGEAYVYYQYPDGKRYNLKEEKQVFKDGRERRRNFPHGVSEKMKANENPQTAIIRGIKEELGIDGDINISKIGMTKKEVDSLSYPGLRSQYISHQFETTLSDEQFNPEGYVEIQDDKRTYFIWEEIK